MSNEPYVLAWMDHIYRKREEQTWDRWQSILGTVWHRSAFSPVGNANVPRDKVFFPLATIINPEISKAAKKMFQSMDMRQDGVDVEDQNAVMLDESFSADEMLNLLGGQKPAPSVQDDIEKATAASAALRRRFSPPNR